VPERLDAPAASAQLLAFVPSIIPRSIWLFSALFCGLFPAPVSGQRKVSATGVIPPQPVQMAIKVRREGKTEIPLRIHGQANEPLKFLVRAAPAHGRLSEPRPTGREIAVAIYEPPADLTITTDRFFYAAQSAAGVSAPVEVALTILDQPPQLAIPEALAFAPVSTGTTSSALLEISNRGGSLAIGEVIVEAPWRIEGKTGYRLGAGDLAIFKIIFAAASGGTFESVARFTSDPAHSTTLRGAAEASIAAQPAQVVLQHEIGDPVRTGSFELINQTDQPRTLYLKSDARLQLPPQVTLTARGRISVPLQTAPGDVRPLDTEIRIVAPDLEFRVPVKAAVPAAVLRAVQRAVAFGQLPVGRAASARFELENIGGAPGEVTWAIGPPFRTLQNSALLLPGEKRAFDLGIESKTPGRYRAWLHCKASAQTFDLPVEAEIVATMRSAKNTGTTPGAPTSAPAEVVAADEPASQETPLAVPADWLGDHVLPAGVKVTATTPTTATLEWPVSLSPATRFQVCLRQFSYADDGNLHVTWLELSGQKIEQAGQSYFTTIHELQPGQPWTVLVLAMKGEGQPGERLFAMDFSTPPKMSILPEVSPFRALLAALLALLAWQAVIRWRRR
jgi:hypothetical protein